ncbi:HNH endonuclease [Chloroflexota bacterium]
MSIWDDDKPKRKAIPKAVKDTVWSKYIGATKAEGKCYVCGRTIHISSFECGHDKAVAKGGQNNISNLRPICKTCNTSMSTTSIETFKAKHFDKPKPNLKSSLNALTVKQLKILADKHHIKVKGQVIDDWLDSHVKPPTKNQYISKLSKIVTARDISSLPKEPLKPAKKKTQKKSDDSWF